MSTAIPSRRNPTAMVAASSLWSSTTSTRIGWAPAGASSVPLLGYSEVTISVTRRQPHASYPWLRALPASRPGSRGRGRRSVHGGGLWRQERQPGRREPRRGADDDHREQRPVRGPGGGRRSVRRQLHAEDERRRRVRALHALARP